MALSLTTASLLGYEVLLTRAIAIQHWHHLTGVVIAVALLGTGCAGSLAAAFSVMVRRYDRSLMSSAALSTAVAMPLSLALARMVPLNMLALPWYGTQQAGWLLLYALCYILPFFCGAVFITLAFMRWTNSFGRCYAADLIGSAMGVILVLVWLDGSLLPETTLESTLGLCAALPILSFVFLESIRPKRIVIAGAAMTCVVFSFSTTQVDLVPADFKSLPVQLAERDARVLWQRDTLQSRLTLVQSAAQHQAPGLSILSRREAPRQWQVYRDGDAAVPLLYDAGQDRYRIFFDEILAGAIFLVAPTHPRVLVLPGNSSWNAWNAHWHQAATVTLVEPDQGMAALLTGKAFDGQSFVPHDCRLEIMPSRRFLQSSDDHFDLIMADMGGSPVGSAATRVQFSLTREALELALERLTPSGILAFSGQIMPLPRDSLRLIHSLVKVLRDQHRVPSEHLVVIRDWKNFLVLVCGQPLAQSRLDALSAWCLKWHFDRVAMPGLQTEEANRFHQKPDALYFKAARRLLSGKSDAFVAAYPFALSVTNDNRPFFYHFFRWGHWQEVRERLGRPWLLYAGWGFLLSHLALAVLTPTAALLILAPLSALTLRRQIAHERIAIPIYFGAIGLGFMFIEIALIQKSLLLVNAPTSAFAVVVVAMLLGAGAGSLWEGRASSPPRGAWAAPLAIGIMALTAPGLIDFLAQQAVSWAYWMQVGGLLLYLLILAVPMGMMLPRGIVRMRHRGAGAVAWAWGINGFCAVLGALAAPLVAIEIGILGVVGCAVCLYGLAGLFFRRLQRAV